LSSITVTTTSNLGIIMKWGFNETSPILRLSEATISTLAITAISHPHHSEDNAADNSKTTND
jgi:hypothetical protein